MRFFVALGMLTTLASATILGIAAIVYVRDRWYEYRTRRYYDRGSLAERARHFLDTQRRLEAGGQLAHLTDDCIGYWRIAGTGVARSILCDRCGAESEFTMDRRLAAIDENYAGIALRRLATAGAAQLERERTES